MYPSTVKNNVKNQVSDHLEDSKASTAKHLSSDDFASQFDIVEDKRE
jgi:hypothetical protein